MPYGEHLINDVLRESAQNPSLRSGQILYNWLPVGASRAVAATLFDPFHKEMSPYELTEWVQNHLVFDNQGEVIAVFNNNELLWEKN